MRPKASILILLTFALLMVLSSVALACPSVDTIRLWPCPWSNRGRRRLILCRNLSLAGLPENLPDKVGFFVRPENAILTIRQLGVLTIGHRHIRSGYECAALTQGCRQALLVPQYVSS
jgi:hypothetical protein